MIQVSEMAIKEAFVKKTDFPKDKELHWVC